jgi:hypothetical protein
MPKLEAPNARLEMKFRRFDPIISPIPPWRCPYGRTEKAEASKASQAAFFEGKIEFPGASRHKPQSYL